MVRAFLVLCAVAVSTSAAAQALTLSPAVIPLRGAPGQSSTQTLTLANTTRLPLEFELEARDVVVRNGKRELRNAGEVPGSIAATAVFSRRSVTIPAGEARAVDVTVTLPPGAEHRAIVAVFRGTTELGPGSRKSTASLGTLLTFTASDATSIAPSELTVKPQTSARNAAFEQLLANDGREPVMPKGVAVILDGGGRIVGRAAFEPQRLLPGERLAFRSEYPGELRPGRYRVLSTFQFAESRSVTRSAELVVR